MDYEGITQAYFARWLGASVADLRCGEYLAVYNEERNSSPSGYSRPFDIYMFHQRDRAIVSFGDKALSNIEPFIKNLPLAVQNGELEALFQRFYGASPNKGTKFIFRGERRTSVQARALVLDDFEMLFAFWREKCRTFGMNAEDRAWLHSYFSEHAERGYFCAVLDEGKIVSCTDAPDMPYMADRVQEIGIHTLSRYRGKGYATEACTAAIRHIVQSGKCPQWSAGAANTASHALAMACGFERYADTYSLTLSMCLEKRGKNR